LDFINELGELVHYRLLNPPIGNTNIGTYCKKTVCWDGIQKLSRKIEEIPTLDYFITIKKEKSIQTESRKLEKLDTGLNDQIKINKLSRTKTPRKLIEFYNSKYAPGITDKGMRIIESWHDGKMNPPSEKQAKVVMGYLRKAIKAGFQEL
jgi:hypothetical protein